MAVASRNQSPRTEGGIESVTRPEAGLFEWDVFESSAIGRKTVEDVFNILETELALLKKYLDPSFLEPFEMFAPLDRGRTPDFNLYGPLIAHLYCFHKSVS